MRSSLLFIPLLALLAACSTTTNTGDVSDECAVGELTCECFPNATCGAGLTCLSNVCVEVSDGTGGSGDGGGSSGGDSQGGEPTGGDSSGGGDPTETGGAGIPPDEIPSDWVCEAVNDGELRCLGDTPAICIEGDWQLDPFSCPAGCADGAGCVCEENGAQCLPGIGGDTLIVCSEGFAPEFVDCKGDTPICVADLGICACSEGDTMCSADVANACVDGFWIPETCSFGCDGKRCRAPQDAPDQVLCDPSIGLVCSGELCAWLPAEGGEPERWECTTTTSLPVNAISTHECDSRGDCSPGQTCCRGADAACRTYCSQDGECAIEADWCDNAEADLVVCNPAINDCPAGKQCAPMDESWADSVPLWGCVPL